jgi:hypothetical protein
MCFESIVIAPNGGAVWWWDAPTPEFARSLDIGTVLSADEDRVVVEWSVASRVPHRYQWWLPRPMLDAELVRAKWKGREFLVPASRMPLFVSQHCSAHSSRAAFAPCKGGWTTADFENAVAMHWDLRVDVDGVPAPWRQFMPATPIGATARLVGEPVVLHGWLARLTPWDPVPGNWEIWKPREIAYLYQCEYELNVGTDAGLRVGMPMFRDKLLESPGTVLHAERKSARVEFRYSASNDEGAPPRTVRLSTNACTEQ